MFSALRCKPTSSIVSISRFVKSRNVMKSRPLSPRVCVGCCTCSDIDRYPFVFADRVARPPGRAEGADRYRPVSTFRRCYRIGASGERPQTHKRVGSAARHHSRSCLCRYPALLQQTEQRIEVDPTPSPRRALRRSARGDCHATRPEMLVVRDARGDIGGPRFHRLADELGIETDKTWLVSDCTVLGARMAVFTHPRRR